jgi:hypothetical protein
MTISASMKSSEGQRLIGQLAEAFNVDDDKAGTAVASLSDELQARIQRSMLSRGGVADVAALVTNPSAAAALSNPGALTSPEAAESGNHILDVLIGSKHVSRKIAARSASRSGLDTGTVEKLLPAVASLLIGELQRQSAPALEKLVSAGGSPLSLPGDDLGHAGGPAEWPPRTQENPATGRQIDPGQPLPVPGDNIPGVGRGSRRQVPQTGDNPFDRLPDIIRRGGQQAPGNGGSLEDVIRSIFGKVLGSNRGIIGTMIQLFLIRWLASLVRRILPRIFGGR